MQTIPTYACMVDDGDTILIGEYLYLITEREETTDDFIIFNTIDEEGELTQLPFGGFDTVDVVVVFD